MPTPRTAIAVPCFNEAARLPTEAFAAFRKERPDVAFTFVDDGSTDGTPELLHALSERDPAGLRVVELTSNRGKAGAVREGMRRAIAEGSTYAGYWDADLATPLDEIPRFVALLDANPGCELVMGSRVKLLGRNIVRSDVRHYLGRVFATAASTTLGIPVYDTQCGAKVFRVGPALARVFEEPFETGWSFDVEILARLLVSRRARGLPDNDGWVYEVPLDSWIDVPGSKVRPIDFVRGLLEVARIRRRTLRRSTRS